MPSYILPLCLQLRCEQWIGIGAPSSGENGAPGIGTASDDDKKDEVNDDKTVCLNGLFHFKKYQPFC
jgi:hypothetical protein